MRRLSSYPRWLFPLMLVILVMLLATGLWLVPPMMEMRLELDSPLHVDSESRLVAAALHSTAAFLTMTLLGALSVVHMRMGWRRRLNRISGLGLVLLFALLMLTAIGIFYFGDDDFSRIASVTHTAMGIVVAVLFCWHLLKGRHIRLER